MSAPLPLLDVDRANEALRAIHALLDEVEWDVETLDEVARVLTDAGFTVHDPEDGPDEGDRFAAEGLGYDD